MGRLRNEFVSLRASMDRLDRLGRAVENGGAAPARGELHELVQAVDHRLFRPLSEKAAAAAPDLSALRRLLTETDAAALHAAFHGALESTSECIRHQLAGTAELAQLLAVLEGAVRRIEARGEADGTELSGVAEGLREAAGLRDVEEFRARVLHQAAHCIRLVDSMREENRLLRASLEQEMGAVRQRLDEAERAARHDALTGLANRRAFETEVQRQTAAGLPFCLLVLDLDHFKNINDRHGHSAGDEVLKAFAERLRHLLRAGDMAARWGGDEFVVILPASLPDAMARARQLDQGLRGEYALPLESPIRVRIGASIGVAEHRPGETASQLFDRADSLLLASKR